MSNVNFIFTQLFGMTATVLLCVSYLVKNKKTFLFLGLMGDIIYGLTFIFVNSWGAGLITFLSCGQYLFVLHYDKTQKQLPKPIAFLFIVSFIVVGCLDFSSVWDIIPILTYILYTFALYYEDIKKIRFVYLVANSLLAIYDIMVMAYANALEDGIESICLLSVVIVDFIKSRKKYCGKNISATLKKSILLHGVKRFYNLYLQSTTAKVKTSDNHNINNSLTYTNGIIKCPINNYG